MRGKHKGGSVNFIYSSWYQCTYSGRKVLAIHSFSWWRITTSVWGLYFVIMAVTVWGRGEWLCLCSYARVVEETQLLCAATAEIMHFPRKATVPFCSYKALHLKILHVSISRSLACWLDKCLKISLVAKLTSFCLFEYINLKKKMDLSGSLSHLTLIRDVTRTCHFCYSPEYFWYLETRKIKRVVFY